LREIYQSIRDGSATYGDRTRLKTLREQYIALGDTRARRPARLHLDLGRVRVTGADLQANPVLDSYCGLSTPTTGCRDGGFRTPTPWKFARPCLRRFHAPCLGVESLFLDCAIGRAADRLTSRHEDSKLGPRRRWRISKPGGVQSILTISTMKY